MKSGVWWVNVSFKCCVEVIVIGFVYEVGVEVFIWIDYKLIFYIVEGEYLVGVEVYFFKRMFNIFFLENIVE